MNSRYISLLLSEAYLRPSRTGVADAAERVFTKVAADVDPVEFYLVEVAAGDRLEFLFLFCLEDIMVKFYFLK